MFVGRPLTIDFLACDQGPPEKRNQEMTSADPFIWEMRHPGFREVAWNFSCKARKNGARGEGHPKPLNPESGPKP